MFIRPNDGRITSHYQPARLDPVGQKEVRAHHGTDFGKDGSPVVVASAAGLVTLARVNGGFGNCVYIKHVINGKIYETVYAHLKTITVKVGETVRQGQQVGLKGTTGNSTGVHLHFEICVGRWNNKYTTNVNPMHYITDPEVKIVQALLVKAGYKLPVDGIAGTSTKNSIKLFQTKYKLVADGIAGKATLAKLKEVTTVPTTRYIDVPKTHTAYNALERLSKLGIINGYEDNTYRPNEPVTRAHIAVIIDRALNAKG